MPNFFTRFWELVAGAGKQKPPEIKTMRDKISADRVAKLHPKVRDEVRDTIAQIEKGFPEHLAVRIVQGLRTIQEQNDLYAQGRTKPGPRVTNAKGGKSFHNYGLAIDFCILINGKEISWDLKADRDKDGVSEWQEVVKAFEAKGWFWGGLFSSIKDYPHLEKSHGYTVSQLLAKYNTKDFIEGEYVRV